MPSKFAGFPSETIEFLSELAENNRRDWFQNNRRRYEDYFLGPSMTFIEAMQRPLVKSAPMLKAVPKTMGGSLMRIYRDTRFSKVKEPYKTNIGIHFRHELGSDVHAPGCYLHIAPDECFFGAGIWMPASEPLRMIREFIQENPTAWKKAVANKRFAETFNLVEDRLRSMPRGFPKDSPMSDALRLKSFIGVKSLDAATIQSADLVKIIDQAIKDSRSLMSTLCAALQIPY